MIHKIVLNGRLIEYDLLRKRVKNVNLRIKSDLSINVSANPRVSVKFIEEFIFSKADFILKSLEKYEKLKLATPQKKQYVDDETFLLLGKDFRLRLREGENKVSVDESYLILSAKDISNLELKSKILDEFFKLKCMGIVEDLSRSVYPYFKKAGVTYPNIKFRKMKSQWGSCNMKKGVLTFNTLLIHTPLSCIEYVVVHEFSHFLVFNHSKKFYEIVEKLIPDWKTRKNLLNTYARNIII